MIFFIFNLIKNKSFLSEYLVNEIKKINYELKDEIYKRKTKICN